MGCKGRLAAEGVTGADLFLFGGLRPEEASVTTVVRAAGTIVVDELLADSLLFLKGAEGCFAATSLSQAEARFISVDLGQMVAFIHPTGFISSILFTGDPPIVWEDPRAKSESG